jgi:long-chain acyl-CoA synthetase
LIAFVLRLGKSNSNFTGPNVTPDDMASICYTSGTTGNPKGVILTHRNLVSACAAINQFINDESSRIIPGIDTTISYLPLAHIYERLAHLSALTRGIGIGSHDGIVSIRALIPVRLF